MLDAIGVWFKDTTCPCEDAVELAHPKLDYKFTIGFDQLHMPNVTISTSSARGLAVLEFKDYGLHCQHSGLRTADGVTVLEHCIMQCRALINLMLDAARGYIVQHPHCFSEG